MLLAQARIAGALFDGRVRNVDFGLAVEAQAVADGAVTPLYMAPELAAGGAVTPATDHYSLCASLREAIAEPRPALIESIVARRTGRCASSPVSGTARGPSRTR